MESSYKVLYDSGATYNTPQMQSLDSHIELASLNYFNKEQNFIKVINGGYEESISSFLFHEIFRYEDLVHLEQKIYIAQNVNPIPDIFVAEKNIIPSTYFQFCNVSIKCYTEFGHHFSYAKEAHINKTLSDFVKWRRLFQQHNFDGEIVTIQYMSHLTHLGSIYNGHTLHGMAAQHINLNNLEIRNQNIIDVANIYKSMGTLKKHSEVKYDNGNIQFAIHIFTNLFPQTLTKDNLYSKFTTDILQLDVITKNQDFWNP